MHKHQHHKVSGKRLLITLVLNFTITIAEFIGGILSGSMALISDAMHNLGDTFSVFTTYIAYKIGSRSPTRRMTFGYKRVEVLAALFNSLILTGIAFGVIYSSINRIVEPQEIKVSLMLGVGSIALIGNVLSVILLHKDAKKSINIRSSYLHLISDALFSLVVIVGAAFVHYFTIYEIDAILGIIIAGVILYNAYNIIRESLSIFMQRAPREVNISALRKDLEILSDVKGVHHLHLWRLSDTRWHFESHVELSRDMPVSETALIKEQIQQIIKNKYRIHHITLEFEIGEEHDKELIPRHGV